MTKQTVMRAHEAAQAPIESDSATPAVMLNRALEKGADPAVIEKFMQLYERWEANEARKAFNIAIAEAKKTIPTIIKRREGHNFKFEDMADIAKVVDPILSELGLGYRYKSESNGEVKVTCVIFHRDGYSEENSLTARPDKSGSKNDIQAIGSTVTYLERYTLKLALGLKVSTDDDGAAAGGTITEEQAMELDKEITDVGADRAKFLSFMGVEHILEIPAKDLKKAKAALGSKRKAKTSA